MSSSSGTSNSRSSRYNFQGRSGGDVKGRNLQDREFQAFRKKDISQLQARGNTQFLGQAPQDFTAPTTEAISTQGGKRANIASSSKFSRVSPGDVEKMLESFNKRQGELQEIRQRPGIRRQTFFVGGRR